MKSVAAYGPTHATQLSDEALLNQPKPIQPNPYLSPKVDTAANAQSVAGVRQTATLALIAGIGIITGSYISAELFHIRFPLEPRSIDGLLSETIGATLSSPISMTLGMIPTLKFYDSHGWLVLPGIILTLAGFVLYSRRGGRFALLLVFLGFVLWSHNNLLAFHALMSV